MYVCVCKAITDKSFEEALEQGNSYEDVCQKLGVGYDCGICLQEAYQKAVSKKHQSQAHHSSANKVQSKINKF
mgnify:CR=1 FL=1